MAEIRITGFSGLIPKVAKRLLPENAAQMAANTKLASGELRPMRKSKKVFTPSAALAVKSIFKVDDSTWFVWPTDDISMIKAPTEGEGRYCYTGDGIPKITTKSLGTPVSASGTPASFRALGIPNPVTAPGVAHSGGVGIAVNRFYIYTFMSDWYEESGPSIVSAFVAGKVDGTWAITGMDAAPSNSGTITGASYAAGVVTISLAANHYLRVGDLFTVTGAVGMTDLNAAHIVKEVPAANQVKVALTTAQTYTSGGAWSRTVPWGPCTKRLYRTSGTASDFQLVAEGITGTTYNDTLTDVQIIGDSFVSASWLPPPVGLKGLIALPNGANAGYVDNIVCVSEPYQPHAWPEEYQRRTHFPVSGIAGLMDSSVVVATTGMPYRITGFEPASMIMERIEKPMPCLSARSVCSIGMAGVYSTRGGLAMINAMDAILLTGDLFTDEDWYAATPETIRCAYARGNLYMVSYANPAQVFIIGIGSDAAGPMVSAPINPDCTHVDAQSGRLYYATLKSVYEFDPDNGVPLVQNWWSKEFVVGKPVNLGAAKVTFSKEFTEQATAAFAAELVELQAANAAIISSGKAKGGINRSAINANPLNGSALDAPSRGEPSIGFVLYADGTQKFYRPIENGKPFKLPSGYKSDVFSVRIISNIHVKSIEVAETIAGLAKV